MPISISTLRVASQRYPVDRPRPGTYVGLRFGNAHHILRSFELVIPQHQLVKVDDVHLTLMYAKDQPFYEVGQTLVGLSVEIQRPRIQVFGENQDTLVLAFNSDTIEDEHRRISNYYGLEHSWPVFQPHITLSCCTRLNQEQVDQILWPTVPGYLDITEQYSNPIDDNWDDK